MPWIVRLSPAQVDYLEETLDDLRDVDYEEEPEEWPYVTDDALVIPEDEGLYIVRERLMLASDEWERGQRKKMVQNILDHIDVATGREEFIPAGRVVEIEEYRGGRTRRYKVRGPWPPRWPR